MAGRHRRANALFSLNGATSAFRIALSTDSSSVLDYLVSDLIVQ
jgi:hypothetical protein